MASERARRPLLDLGACTVGFSKATLAEAIAAEGVMIGSWHVPFDLTSEDNGHSQITVEGTVRRIRGYERSARLIQTIPGSVVTQPAAWSSSTATRCGWDRRSSSTSKSCRRT